MSADNSPTTLEVLLKEDDGGANVNMKEAKLVEVPRKQSMAPPPVPASPTVHRMTRLPSLQQISDRLHHPLPLSTQPPSSTNIGSSSSGDTLGTPPKLKVAINPTGSTHSSPYTSSPSGRLKLPASAMMRSQSSSSSMGLPTLATFDKERVNASRAEGMENLKEGGLWSTSDPFGSPSAPKRPVAESMSRAPSMDAYIKGYRDVPSLSAIRDRMGSLSSARQFLRSEAENLNNTATPIKEELASTKELPIPELITPSRSAPADRIEPATSHLTAASSSAQTSAPTATNRQEHHALRHPWTLFFDSKSYKPPSEMVTPKEGEQFLGDYEKSLVTVGTFETVEGFARHFNNVRLPSSLTRNSNYHMFKDGIRPMWEDPANANGGKWVVLLRSSPHLLDSCWANLAMALVGEILDPENQVCGLVASTRPKVDRIQIWTRIKDDVDAINLIGRRTLEAMALEGRDVENLSLEFQYNESTTSPAAGTFLHIAFSNRAASYAHTPTTPSRLNVSTSEHGLTHHPSLPHLPKSPLSPRSPLSARTGDFRDNKESSGPGSGGRDSLAPPPGLGSTQRRGSASSAFSGPMGKFPGIVGSTSPRRASVQLGEDR